MEMIIVAIVSVVFGVVMGVLATQNRKKLLQQEVATLHAQVENMKEESKEKLEFVSQEKEKVYQGMLDAKDKACSDLIEEQCPAEALRRDDGEGLGAGDVCYRGDAEKTSEGVCGFEQRESWTDCESAEGYHRTDEKGHERKYDEADGAGRRDEVAYREYDKTE